MIYDITDHLPNFIIINNYQFLTPNVKIYKRDYSNLIEADLIAEIQAIDWQSVLTENMNPSHMFDSFYCKLR